MQISLTSCGGSIFGGKRRLLLKQLWKMHLAVLSRDGVSMTTPSSAAGGRKAALKALTKRLKDRQMDALAQSLTSADSGCVMVSGGDVALPGGLRVPPQVLACQLWRWADLDREKKLKPLPICRSALCSSSSSSSSQVASDAVVCCNPHHWSMTVPEENFSPMLLSLPHETQPLSSSSSSSSSSSGEDASRSWKTPWCKLVYREYQNHIGGIFPVVNDTTRVFQDLFQGDGMCLSVIQKPTTSRPIDRTRSKIGRGILLSRERDNTVWLYNCSEHPVFVCSPSFTPEVLSRLSKSPVRRVSPGCSLVVYDCDVVDRLVSLEADDGKWTAPPVADGPVFYDSVLVSFVKGWGKHYKRRLVTSCPCWMELLLMRQ